jgi:hypothetical protein
VKPGVPMSKMQFENFDGIYERIPIRALAASGEDVSKMHLRSSNKTHGHTEGFEHWHIHSN